MRSPQEGHSDSLTDASKLTEQWTPRAGGTFAGAGMGKL
jgi:hypothetical protein